MESSYSMRVIAHIHTDFPTKFGIPRQSDLTSDLEGIIVFEKEYRVDQALREIEQFSHLWLIWVFSDAVREQWSPTVRPPRLGGNRRVGVFATRSPYRPNPIGLSSVRLERVETHPQYGTVLRVRGADLMDGTPILDIKPYLPFSDSHPDAVCGYANEHLDHALQVQIDERLLSVFPEQKRAALRSVLSQDPRPSYQNDPERIYGFFFAGCEIHFTVDKDTLYVRDIQPMKPNGNTQNGYGSETV